MELNSIKPSAGAKHAKRRVGRGIGSGLGKTAGRGHKGQKSRSGGYHKVGFEGGQMPLQRRLPKRGFKSHLLKYNAEITLSELQALGAAEVDVLSLKQAGLIPQIAKVVKVIKSGELTKKVVLKGIGATAGAKAAILASIAFGAKVVAGGARPPAPQSGPAGATSASRHRLPGSTRPTSRARSSAGRDPELPPGRCLRNSPAESATPTSCRARRRNS